MTNFFGLFLFILTYTLAITSLVTGIIIYLQDKKKYFYFFILSLFITFYLFFYSFVYISKSESLAMIFYQISSLGWLPIPFLALLFVLSFLEKESPFIKKYKYYLSIPLAPFLFFILKRGFLATGFVSFYGTWNEVNEAQPILIILYIIIVISYLGLAHFYINKEKKKLKSNTGKTTFVKILQSLQIMAFIIIPITLIISRIFPGRIPALTHFISAFIFLLCAYTIFSNRNTLINPYEILRAVFQDDKIDVFHISNKGKIEHILYLSPDFLHWRKKDLLHMPLMDLFDGTMSEKGFKKKWLHNDLKQVESRLVDKPGRAVSVMISIRKQYSRYGEHQGYLFIARDYRQVTHLKENLKRLSGSNTELRDKAIKDPLTGIYNRAKFMATLERETFQGKHYAQPIGVIMFDIDHFKRVNDTFGHDIGDYVLVELVSTIGKQLREEDLFSRWGGEEFMILCRNTQLDHVKALAERLRLAVESMKLKKVKHITASFGVSNFQDKDDQESFLKRVDENLYKAKEGGRNMIVSDEI